LADPPSYPGAPRWLRIFGVVVGIVGLLFVVLIHGSLPHHNMPFVGTLDHGASHAPQESGR
jgi:hypothetical protein